MEEKNEFPHEVSGFNIELEAGDLLIKPLEHLKINLLKEVMKYFAFDLGNTDNKIDYEINAEEKDFEEFNVYNNIGMLGLSFGKCLTIKESLMVRLVQLHSNRVMVKF